MAVSKKKSAAKKKSGRRATSSKAKGSSSAPKKPKSVTASKAPPKRKTAGSKQAPSVAKRDRTLIELQDALAQARSQIAQLLEDRETQVAIAEAAEAERSMLQDELEDAQSQIRNLERKMEEREQSPSAAAPEAEDLAYEDEEEAEPDAEDLDDVESIYNRMDDPRVRRQELDRERVDRESEVGDESYWLVCPKCGGTLEEADAGDVKLDRCENCGGLYLDQGEVDMLLSVARGPEGLHRIRTILQF
jgi:hypothetical protein